MSNNLCIIEDLEDLEVFKKKNFLKKNYIFAPLNLETFIECKKLKIEIINFEKYLNNEFHKNSLEISKKFTDSIKFLLPTEHSLKFEIRALLRFRLHSIIFLIELINRSLIDLKFNKIIVSGITKKNHLFNKNKLTTEIIYYLYKSKFHPVSAQIQENENNPILYRYTSNSKVKKNRKILMSNGGYNFYKLSQILKGFGIDCWILSFKKISLIKKIFFKLFYCLNILYFEKTNLKVKYKNFIQPLNFVYSKKFNLSKILNLFNNKLLFYFNDLNERILAVKNKVNKENFNLIISNIARGLDGSVLDQDVKAPSMCVSHGIVCKGIKKHDKIYKKIIAEAVFSGNSKYFSIQSKVMNDSLKTHKILGKKIITGNLIFASSKNLSKKKYFLFASTVKDFGNLQFLGVEMFYEYFNTIKELDLIAKNSNEEIVVKVHPSVSRCASDLAKLFKNLTFSNSKIEILLKKTIALISYSSSSIEDALNSSVPVILYDPYDRYQHLQSLSDQDQDKTLNYVRTTEELVASLQDIKRTKSFRFKEYVYNYDLKNSIKNKIIPLMK